MKCLQTLKPGQDPPEPEHKQPKPEHGQADSTSSLVNWIFGGLSAKSPFTILVTAVAELAQRITIGVHRHSRGVSMAAVPVTADPVLILLIWQIRGEDDAGWNNRQQG